MKNARFVRPVPGPLTVTLIRWNRDSLVENNVLHSFFVVPSGEITLIWYSPKEGVEGAVTMPTRTWAPARNIRELKPYSAPNWPPPYAGVQELTIDRTQSLDPSDLIYW